MTGRERALDVCAAVAHRAGAPLTLETVQLDDPTTGEARVEINANGNRPTDV